jgi:hypothetical protein
VQRQPLLRLPDAVVVELVIDPAPAKRFDQVAPDTLRELAAVNGDMDYGRHAPFVAKLHRQDKLCRNSFRIRLPIFTEQFPVVIGRKRVNNEGA